MYLRMPTAQEVKCSLAALAVAGLIPTGGGNLFNNGILLQTAFHYHPSIAQI